MTNNQAGTAPSVKTRQSDRIRYAYRLHIKGQDSSGCAFDEEARTELITRDGGLIVTAVSMSSGTVIAITRGNKTANARVVGQVGLRNEEYLYGVQFLETAKEPFWDVHFAAPDQSGSVGKLVLQCSRCSRQEVLHLSEVEMMVHESTQVISHYCRGCNLESLWVEPEVLGEDALLCGNDAYQMNMSAPVRSRTINDRKHTRVQMRNIRACLHRQGFEDDIVTVSNLSRGGIAFISMVDYVPGTLVEVAVPYTEGGANVFTPAKVVRVRCRPTVDLPGEFGLAYLPR
jgi:hypothetical protein